MLYIPEEGNFLVIAATSVSEIATRIICPITMIIFLRKCRLGGLTSRIIISLPLPAQLELRLTWMVRFLSLAN